MNKIDRVKLAYKDEIRGVYDRKVFPAPAEGLQQSVNTTGRFFTYEYVRIP